MSRQLFNLAHYRLKSMQTRLYASAGPCTELFSSLRRDGLDLATVQAHAGVYAVVLARFSGAEGGDIMFDLDPEGVPAAVIEAFLYDQNQQQFVADLVAWPLHDPAYFATALGPHAGSDVLGVEHMVLRSGQPLRVYCTPLEWLQAGCVGCVPLTGAGGRYWLEKAGGPFVVGSLEEGQWLRDYLGSAAAHHRILLPIEERIVA